MFCPPTFHESVVASRCQILRLQCTISFVGWSSAPDATGGAYNPPPDPLAGFKGPTFKGDRGGDGRTRRREGKRDFLQGFRGG